MLLANAAATTPSSTKGSTPSPARNAARWHPAGTDRAEAESPRHPARGRTRRAQRRGPLAHLRCLPHRPVAARQEAHPVRERLPGLRAQDPSSHPPDPRPQTAPPAPATGPRAALHLDAAADRRTGRTGTQDRLRSPPHHPRCPRRRGPTRTRHSQRRPRRSCAPAAVHSPGPKPQAWTAAELQTFLRAAAGHRLFPALWLIAMTGMRRNELLGLQVGRPRRHPLTALDQPRARRRRLRAPPDPRQDRPLPALHRPRPDHPHRPRRLAGPADRRVRRRRHRPPRTDVHRPPTGEPVHPHAV